MQERIDRIKLKESSECCPCCTNIEKCRAYSENGESRLPENYKWSESCCERCDDVNCFQNPFYVMDFLRKEILKDNKDVSKDYHNEALQTILVS